MSWGLCLSSNLIKLEDSIKMKFPKQPAGKSENELVKPKVYIEYAFKST